MLKFGSQMPVLWTATDKFLVKAKGTQLTTAPSKSDIIIKQPPESRFKEVIDHVTVTFLRDEPLSKRVPRDTTGQRERDVRQYANDMVRSGLSVMATDGPEGPVVGACLNKVLSKKSVMSKRPQEPGPDDDALLPNVTYLLTTIHQKLDLFSSLGLDEILNIGILSVDPTYTRRGIGKRLMKYSLELAAHSGVRAAKTDCSGKISTQLAQHIGMGIIFQFPYANYLRSGRVVFPYNGDGNDVMTVLAARLQPEKPYVLPIKSKPSSQ